MGNHATPPEPSDPARLTRLLWPFVLGLTVLAILWMQLPDGTTGPKPVSYSEIKLLIRNGEVREATLEATAIVAVLRSQASDDAERVRAITPQQPDPTLMPLLEEKGVIATALEPRAPSMLVTPATCCAR